MDALKTDVRFVKGIGEKRAKLLNRLSIFTLSDFLTYFPRDYEDRTRFMPVAELSGGVSACIKAVLATEVRVARTRGAQTVTKARVFDETGSLSIVFFNQPYVKERLQKGKEYIFFGRVQSDLLGKELINPVFEPAAEAGKTTGRILPVYPLISGLTRNIVMQGTQAALSAFGDGEADALPSELRERYKLAHARFAYENIHFPKTLEDALLSRRRFVFEELFFLSIGLKQLKNRRQEAEGIHFQTLETGEFLPALGFALTGAQRRAIGEAALDMASGKLMNRLVQGDVGSGKTAVAAACIYLAAKNGYQSALMAPTSILAEQHFQALSPLFERFSLKTGLLTGSMSAKEKVLVCEMARSGEIDLLIGTHALIEKEVGFLKLALVVTDEQHRFGVRQRAALSGKGGADRPPHTLVMSATPIPRTLALILYGDLDVSVIDELPPGRKEIKTALRTDAAREKAFQFIRGQLALGRQAYIVCPLVDENGNEELKATQAYARELKKAVFSDFELGVLHGRLKPSEKEEMMRRFSRNEIQVLVSTTVIEVGVNVPNATVMVVENAERFGLSQLHQLRGRVGRGEEQSYCILFTESRSEETLRRLKALCGTNDGFQIAEEDLRLRGPGDFFGKRQHGLPEMRIASFVSDVKTLKEAQNAAEELLKTDPELERPEHAGILRRVKELFERDSQGILN